MKIDPLALHWMAAITAIIALVLMNIFGTESQTLTNILSGVIGAAVWGSVQRQKEPVDEGEANGVPK